MIASAFVSLSPGDWFKYARRFVRHFLWHAMQVAVDFFFSENGFAMPKGKKGLSAEQQAELKEAFDLFDADKSGQIDVRARSRDPFASIFSCSNDRGHDC